GPKTSIICSPMTSLKTSIKTITYLSDIGCLEIQGASLLRLPDRKRKLTAVCSHDASIGNVGAPLSIFVEPEETDQIV
ncbi:hypothetical protein, partial [Escherichia coli]|uniref:hypothetical protein n=1 Tax=Escherichia coli TaxID=562 RepID=UPI001BCD101A